MSVPLVAKPVILTVPYEKLIAQAKAEPGASIYRLEQLIAELKNQYPHLDHLHNSPISPADQWRMATIMRNNLPAKEWNRTLIQPGLHGYLCNDRNFLDLAESSKWDLTAYPGLAGRIALAYAAPAHGTSSSSRSL